MGGGHTGQFGGFGRFRTSSLNPEHGSMVAGGQNGGPYTPVRRAKQKVTNDVLNVQNHHFTDL